MYVDLIEEGWGIQEDFGRKTATNLMLLLGIEELPIYGDNGLPMGTLPATPKKFSYFGACEGGVVREATYLPKRRLVNVKGNLLILDELSYRVLAYMAKHGVLIPEAHCPYCEGGTVYLRITEEDIVVVSDSCRKISEILSLLGVEDSRGRIVLGGFDLLGWIDLESPYEECNPFLREKAK